MTNKFRTYLEISKIDDDERMVYGWASTPDIDCDGEIITFDALKAALPAYLKFPTLREMHQPKVAGTIKEAQMKSTKKTKGLYIGAKVVSDEAWKYVKEGVYKAFSIGGNVIKRVKNIINEIELVEISLVDVPANKAAVIELWKAGKLSKDAETAYTMANLMIQIKDLMYYYEYMGKDTKKLAKILEMVKAMVSTEAAEAEPAKNGEVGPEKTQLPTYLKSMAESLKSMQFETAEQNLLREGVIIAMLKKAEEIDEKEGTDETVDETPAADEATDSTTVEEDKSGAENEEETVDETEDLDDLEEEEDKEAAATPSTLQKLDAIEKKLEKLNPTEEKGEKMEIQKTLNKIGSTLGKLVDAIEKQDQRLVKLENQPLTPKSKMATVFKGQEPEDKKEETSNDPEIAAKQARLAEINKKFDTMTPNMFAKSGLSAEAQKLESEIEYLMSLKA